MPSTAIIVTAAAVGAMAARSHKKTCVTLDGKTCQPQLQPSGDLASALVFFGVVLALGAIVCVAINWLSRNR